MTKAFHTDLVRQAGPVADLAEASVTGRPLYDPGAIDAATLGGATHFAPIERWRSSYSRPCGRSRRRPPTSGLASPTEPLN